MIYSEREVIHDPAANDSCSSEVDCGYLLSREHSLVLTQLDFIIRHYNFGGKTLHVVDFDDTIYDKRFVYGCYSWATETAFRGQELYREIERRYGKEGVCDFLNSFAPWLQETGMWKRMHEKESILVLSADPNFLRQRTKIQNVLGEEMPCLVVPDPKDKIPTLHLLYFLLAKQGLKLPSGAHIFDDKAASFPAEGLQDLALSSGIPHQFTDINIPAGQAFGETIYALAA